ncbi:MAG: chemotaxis protein CheD [Candidatus Omnitrophica bacterium]|nr:chemotaxis protein CheD [Candidatus Omnitrophota bacterium]
MSIKSEIAVGIADIKVGKSPTVLTTSLGSCIGVCLYSPRFKVGGLLHLMMAYASDAVNRDGVKKEKFANTGIPELIKQIKTLEPGAAGDLQAKIFGGAKVLKNVTSNIGENNEVATRKILQENGIRITKARTGGEKGYRIKFDLETGVVKAQVFGQPAEDY